MKIKNKLFNAIPSIIVSVIFAIFTAFLCYVCQPSWDFQFAATWWILASWIAIAATPIVAFIVASSKYSDGDERIYAFGYSLLTPVAILLITAILMAIFGLANGALCNANKYFNYAKQNVTVVDSEVQLPNIIGENGDTSKIAIIEDNEAFKKANIVLAEAQLGNKNSINNLSITSQEVNGEFVYVLTIAPNSWFKWDGTTKGYVVVNRTTGDTKIINTEFKYSIDAKFGCTLMHGTNNVKKLLREQIGGHWVDIDMELDDAGNPYWVATQTTQSGVAGYTKVVQTAVVDPITGEIKTYKIGEEPEWVERVYPEEVIIEYIGYYGKYIHGFTNSWKEGKDVLNVTPDYNIVYIDGVPHVWTGMTTNNASNEASSGIAIGNLKTGKITIYKCGGVSEAHAQKSAEGLVKEKGYEAGFPVIINVNDNTSYFMLLRDDNKNVQGYAFVSYKDYTKAAFGTTVSEALNAYKSKLNTVNSAVDMENAKELSVTGAVVAIGDEVVEGRTTYYLKIEGSNKVYVMQSGLNVEIVFLQLGDVVTIKYYENNADVVTANAISIK